LERFVRKGWEITLENLTHHSARQCPVKQSGARRALALSLFLALLAFTAQAQLAPNIYGPPQDSPLPPIRVSVHLVNVFVTVTDANGAPVPNLTQSDFALAEDGHPQKIAFFERDTGMPLSIVMAIDTSGSVHKDLSIERSAAHNFVHALLRPGDQLDLMDFNSDVREVVGFTNNLHRIDAGLDNLSSGPATALYDAVYLASQSLAQRRGRKVLVLISDGGNTVKGTDYPQALEQALRGEVMVYSIIDQPILADAGRDTAGEHAMITLSEQTGGKYYYAGSGNLDEIFRKVSEDLRTQYLIGYYPTRRIADQPFRAIRVTLPNNSSLRPFTIRHRTGYYASPGQ
jgi:Ca-activated chloride channel family protein